MQKRIERLRLWLLVAAVLLLAVLAVFIGSARYVKRHFLARLPAKLGINIKSSANEVTYSQSLGGRTVYVIHAATKNEYTNGKMILHDVRMVLYGRKGDRADRIEGKDFEYDQNTGVVRAIGLVHIDLRAAGPNQLDPDDNSEDPVSGGAKVLHATTSGLVYTKDLGVAATAEPIEFQTGQMTGHAIGAEYNTDTGTLILQSAVSMTGIAGGHPVNLTASTAQIESRAQRTLLTHARYASLGESMAADQAILHTRTDNSLERIEAQGSVTLTSNAGTVISNRGDITMTAKNQPQLAVLTGGVRYSGEQPLRQARGESSAATISWDASGQPDHAVFTGTVHIIERTRPTEDPREPWSVRDLTAARVDTSLVEVIKGRSQIRDADASGSAHLTLIDNGSLSSTRGRATTDLAADDLKVHLIPAADPKQSPHLDTLTGRGHTLLHQLNAAGLEQTSTGDTLDAKFRPAVTKSSASKAATATSSTNRLADDLLSAVQEGHVHVTRRLPAKPAIGQGSVTPEELQDVTAQRAAYDGDTDRLNLTGGIRLTQADSTLWADHATLDHTTGDAQAEGSVKVSYLQPSQQAPGASSLSAAASPQSQHDPIHVLADRAEFNHANDVATFFGKPARMWQNGSQVLAPSLEMARKQKQMTAHSGPNGQVETILVSRETVSREAASTQMPSTQAASPQTSNATASSAKTTTPKGPHVIRILSRDLVYTDATSPGTQPQAVFTGGIRAESAGETLRAREATAYLSSTKAPAAPTAKSSPAAMSLDGRLDHLVATGSIEINAPGRRATGERLIYTAADQMYLLTGTAATPPKALNTRRGTVVSAPALRFHGNDESVEALSTIPGENLPDGKVQGEAAVKSRKEH